MNTLHISEFEHAAVPLGLLGLKISQNGETLVHRIWDEECRRNVYSATKSFTACAVGFAASEGLLSLTEKLTDVFPEKLPESVSENLQKATVRDLLTMCLGQESGSLMGAQRPLYSEDNWVRLALSIPFPYEPGTHFVYNNVGPYLAGILVQRRAGCDLVSYLTPRLFTPLGIKRPTWETDPLGNTFGAGGLFLTLSELHKFGLFCLQRGTWNDIQLLPSEWLTACAGPQDDPGYGYLFWRGEHNSWRADGKYSQLSIVFPDQNAVITTVAECRRSREFLRAVYDYLYPGL